MRIPTLLVRLFHYVGMTNLSLKEVTDYANQSIDLIDRRGVVLSRIMNNFLPRGIADHKFLSVEMHHLEPDVYREVSIDDTRPVIGTADILSIIEEIADKTNVLAMNAALESLKIGRLDGRPVDTASEILSLVRRTEVMTTEVRGVLGKSTEGINLSISLMGEAWETMNQILSSLSHVANTVTEISSATQKDEGIREINRLIDQMNDATKKNASLVLEAAAATESISKQLKSLADEVPESLIGRL
jgi:hypothetical protein